MRKNDESELNNLVKDCINEIKVLKNEINGLKNELEKCKKNKTDSQVNFEKQCYDSQQYVRRNNVEIAGIPDIYDNVLEEKVIEICDSIGIKVTKTDIEACHRMFRPDNILGPKKTIVRFVNRRIAEQLIDKRKNITSEIVQRIGFPSQSKIYINDNLCTYYRKLWQKCRELKAKKRVQFVSFASK